MSDEARDDKIDGWMRAIEALLLQMPEVTEERIASARAHLDAVRANGPNGELAKKVRDGLRPGKSLDEHGDNALRDLLQALKDARKP